MALVLVDYTFLSGNWVCYCGNTLAGFLHSWMPTLRVGLSLVLRIGEFWEFYCASDRNLIWGQHKHSPRSSFSFGIEPIEGASQILTKLAEASPTMKQVKLFIFSLLWSLTLSCSRSPPSAPPRDSCEYCPECARVSTAHIGGTSSFAKIKEVIWFSFLYLSCFHLRFIFAFSLFLR